MPQVIPGNQSNTTQTPVVAPAASPIPSQQVPPSQSPWNDMGGWGWNPGSDNPNPNEKRLTPQERVEMIEKLYQEVLGRNPDTRDINYYKYSTLSEEEIKKQLLTGKEHKQLLDDGRDYKKMKDRAMQAETRVKMLESQITDQVQEFKHLSDLLTEKNKYIQQLREKLNDPYNLSSSSVKPLPIPQSPDLVKPQHESKEVFSIPTSSSEKPISETKKKLFNLIKNFLPD